ncbi:vWA domain-containing protein [Campylobacter sp.]|uniref:vWA domain-containing protein n=1 Tax=Campylobacter sp. TaxID=205 RepID=UPI002A592D55|nr:vWA domain-containing protein [Campylobacter sp.]MDD7090623.1 VWA domain-containing protein [Campylobacteraceae bacterium]MDY5285620.1 vWA domain-containing protein [Campylobacter sp.]
MSKNKDAWGAVEGFVNSATIPLNLPQSLYFLKFKDIGKSILASFVEKEYKNYKEYKEFGELERFKDIHRLDDEDMAIFERLLEEEKKDPKKFNIKESIFNIMENIDKEPKSSLNPKLEIAILSDTTGSMSGEINSVKAQAKKIVETAFSKDENARIGVFGYNDPDVQTFTGLTNNKSAIISAINALYARDGGDTPEMTYKGIINAASSSWSPNADKKIIIFGDAPAKDTYNKAEAYALLSGGSSDEPMARLALPASILSLLASESQSAELETSNDTSKIKVYAIQTGGGSDVEKEFRELAEFSGGEYVKLENDSDVAQTILNIIEHGSVEVDLGKSYELDFSSEKNSQIIANKYGSIDINDELENLIFNYKNNDLIIKHPNSGTQAIIKDFLAPNNELSKIKIRSEILEFSQIKELAYAQSGKDSVIYAKSSEGDFSLNDNISVFFSSDKNTATNITINNKKDNYIISSLKDDNITLGFGNDTFIYKGGRDSLKNSGGNDRVVFENISFNSAEFSKENYNLKISLGAGNELVVGNYFKEGKIEDFQFSDKGLKSDEVNLLIFKNIAEIA